jgi:uncharacterized membrane protein
METHSKLSEQTRRLCIAALFMSFNVILSSIGIPVPGGHLYMNDIIIVCAAVLLDPLSAFLVGGVGAFLGDFFFYPAPMFVSLVSHGLQAVIISWCSHNILQNHKISASFIGAVLGGIVMVIGYTLGRAYIYATPEYAVIKLPYEFLQAGLGIVFGLFLVWKTGIRDAMNRVLHHNRTGTVATVRK